MGQVFYGTSDLVPVQEALVIVWLRRHGHRDNNLPASLPITSMPSQQTFQTHGSFNKSRVYTMRTV